MKMVVRVVLWGILVIAPFGFIIGAVTLMAGDARADVTFPDFSIWTATELDSMYDVQLQAISRRL